MPALTRPAHPTTITLPPRAALVAATTDVLVVGGGPAGIGAALGAAEAGADGRPRRALRVPRRQRDRGPGHAADVVPHPADRVRASRAPPSCFPTDHGPGEPVVAGALARLLEPAGRDRRRARARYGDRLHRAVRPRAVQARRARDARRGRGQVPVPRLRERRDRRRPGARRGVRDQVRPAGGRGAGGGRLHRRRRRRGARRRGLRDRPQGGRPGPADDADVPRWCSSSRRASRPTCASIRINGAACTACGT